MKNLTSGTSEHIPLHSQTIQAICEEYHTRRQQTQQPYLQFRTHKKNKNLPWIPWKYSVIKLNAEETFTFMKLKLKTWYSRNIQQLQQDQ